MIEIMSSVAMAVLTSVALSPSDVKAGDAQVTLYSRTHLERIEPLIKNFEKETGIKVNFVFEEEIDDRLIIEGENSPADVLLTTEIGRINKFSKMKLVQPIKSKAVDKNVPAIYRAKSKEWYAISLRARAVFTSKERVGALPADFNYLDLAKPEYKGKVCMREGKHASNQSLIASLIEHYGEGKTKEFLKGLKANLVQKPAGKDRQQIKLINDGKCDYALAGSNFSGRMLSNPVQKKWAESAVVNFPNGENGVHMNITAVALAKYAPNKANALKFIEYLTSERGQAQYAELNYEYPVKSGLSASDFVQSLGKITLDQTDLNVLLRYNRRALELLKEVKFDN